MFNNSIISNSMEEKLLDIVEKNCNEKINNFLSKYKDVKYDCRTSTYKYEECSYTLIELNVWDKKIKEIKNVDDRRKALIGSITINFKDDYLDIPDIPDIANFKDVYLYIPDIANFGVNDKFKKTGLAKLLLCTATCICYKLLKEKYPKKDILSYPITLTAADKAIGLRKNKDLPKDYILKKLNSFKLVKYYMKTYGFKIHDNLIMKNTIKNILKHCIFS